MCFWYLNLVYTKTNWNNLKSKKNLEKFLSEKVIWKEWIEKYSTWTPNCVKLVLIKSKLDCGSFARNWVVLAVTDIWWKRHILSSCTVFWSSYLVLLISLNFDCQLSLLWFVAFPLIKFVKFFATLCGYWTLFLAHTLELVLKLYALQVFVKMSHFFFFFCS